MDKEALLAATKGDLRKLRQRLDEGIDIDAQDTSGRTLLHHATSNGQYEVVEYLLKHGADVLVTTNKNNTALHIAAIRDTEPTEAMKATSIILRNVARKKLRKLLDAKTKATGNTALHAAVKLCNDPVVVLNLLSYGANCEICNDAGEMPIDLLTNRRRPKDTYPLLEMIRMCFAYAREGDAQPIEHFNQKYDPFIFIPVTISRNSEGHTLMQEYILNGHLQLARELVYLRDQHPIFDELGVLWFEPSRKYEVDSLVEGAQEFCKIWLEQKTAMTSSLMWIPKVKPSAARDLVTGAVKICCAGLKRAHKVLLTYYQYQGEHQSSMTLDFQMRSLEEAMEVLGFDTEECYHSDNCYYEKLSTKWKDDVKSFLSLMDCVIYESINCYVRNLTTAQLFHAVKDEDLEKVQRLLDGDVDVDVVDHNARTVLCYASESGHKKIVKLLLKSSAMVIHERSLLPFTLAAEKGHTKIVKLLLKKADPSVLAENIDWYPEDSSLPHNYTALHAAAKIGHFSILKTLLKYGANYRAVDSEGRTPLDVSTSPEITEFLRLVDNCFDDAQEAKAELAHKLKAIPTDDFLAVASTRNPNGQTLAVVTTKAKAKNIAGLILRMIREAKSIEK